MPPSRSAAAAFARAAFARAALALAAFALAGAAPAAHAQAGLALKRAAAEGVVSCAAVPPRRLTTSADSLRARALASSGAEAALLGDVALARGRLEQAAALGPRLPDVSYQLARLYAEAGDADAAAREFCRYLAIAPTAADSADARRRLVALRTATAEPDERAQLQFRTGLTYAQRGDFLAAAQAFETAAAREPDWATAHYDRGVALVAAGRLPEARAALGRYLVLRPDAADAELVADAVTVLGSPRREPGLALAAGIVPGGSQLYTGRPVQGALLAGIAAATLVYAAQTSTDSVSRTFRTPFGTPYTTRVAVTERPNLAGGLAAAGGLVLIGAVEGWLWTRRRERAVASFVRGTAERLRATDVTTDARVGAAVEPLVTSRGVGLAIRW